MVLGEIVSTVLHRVLLILVYSGRMTITYNVAVDQIVSFVAGYGLLLLMAFLGLSVYNKRCLRDGQKGCALSMAFALMPLGVHAVANLITSLLYYILWPVIYSQEFGATTIAMVTTVLNMVLSLIGIVITVLGSCAIFSAVAKKKRI